MANFPDGVVEVVIRGTYQLTRWTNVFHLLALGLTPGDPDQMADLASDFVGALESSLFYAGSADSFAATDGTITTHAGGTVSSLDFLADTLVGTDSSGQNFAGVAAVVSWKGLWSYRGGKPRTYVGGLTEGWVNEPGTLDGGHVASLQDAAVSLIDLVADLDGSYGDGVALGVMLGHTDDATGTFAGYTGAQVKQQVGSQRRRNRNA